VQNYKYGGLQTIRNKTVTMSLCSCGNSYGKHGPSDQCNIPCTLDPSKICGGIGANTIVTIEGQCVYTSNIGLLQGDVPAT